MCEKVKKTAKELSDDEMDKVAGGNVANIMYRGQFVFIQLCKCPNMVKSSSLYFVQVNNSCPCYIKEEGNSSKGLICQSCIYSDFYDESISKKDEILKKLTDDGYKIHEG